MKILQEITESQVTDAEYDLQSRGKYWQKKLRLQDWEIRFVWDTSEADGSDSCARVSYKLQHRRAEITVKPLADSGPKPLRWEAAIIHELLHLLLSPFTGDAMPNTAGYIEEQIIGSLTELISGYQYLDDSWREQSIPPIPPVLVEVFQKLGANYEDRQ